MCPCPIKRKTQTRVNRDASQSLQILVTLSDRRGVQLSSTLEAHAAFPASLDKRASCLLLERWGLPLSRASEQSSRRNACMFPKCFLGSVPELDASKDEMLADPDKKLEHMQPNVHVFDRIPVFFVGSVMINNLFGGYSVLGDGTP